MRGQLPSDSETLEASSNAWVSASGKFSITYMPTTLIIPSFVNISSFSGSRDCYFWSLKRASFNKLPKVLSKNLRTGILLLSPFESMYLSIFSKMVSGWMPLRIFLDSLSLCYSADLMCV